MGALSMGHWLIVLLVVVLIFGTAKLKNMGKDLGSAVKGFKEAVKDGEEEMKQPAKIEKHENENIVNSEKADEKDNQNV